MMRLMTFLLLGVAVGLAAALYISARDELEAEGSSSARGGRLTRLARYCLPTVRCAVGAPDRLAGSLRSR